MFLISKIQLMQDPESNCGLFMVNLPYFYRGTIRTRSADSNALPASCSREPQSCVLG